MIFKQCRMIVKVFITNQLNINKVILNYIAFLFLTNYTFL